MDLGDSTLDSGFARTISNPLSSKRGDIVSTLDPQRRAHLPVCARASRSPRLLARKPKVNSPGVL